ncbi:hypothetical protein PENFLA_c004G01909 [Penicillium flavigenum]|uniref:Uncharacterized protein n=1 Tax=Penicillium flavigenum TaxID=254877 RepID=A0A1V6TTV1_9EURO|nr:hypothetical protein PENFLA_c004G01909 [Penicillium flavigenum]
MESLSARQSDMINNIHNKVSLLKTDGLTNRDQKTLKNNRLSFIWGEPRPSSESSVTTWRKSRARRAYEEIQDVSYHLFIAVAIEVPPTECGRISFEAILDYILQQEGYEQYNFNLGPTARRFFDSTAAEQSFSGGRRYISFIRSLFPKARNKTYGVYLWFTGRC